MAKTSEIAAEDRRRHRRPTARRRRALDGPVAWHDVATLRT